MKMSQKAVQNPGRKLTEVSQDLDPLYVIFEQHLFNFQDSDSDRKTFIRQIVLDYLAHLNRHGISVPKSLESAVVDELAVQVSTMLTKKIYGCLSIEEYVKGVKPTMKAKAKNRYKRLGKTQD